jgi:hypothetical protein
VEKQKPIYVIAGPTASGKSELGIELALKTNGEIINCDSVQVYREIEIATAKIPFEERRGVPHHLIDYVDPRTNYTAAGWAKDAIAKIAGIEARGNTAILVGGTGFYLRALRQPFFEGPKTDESIREKASEPKKARNTCIKCSRGSIQIQPRGFSRAITCACSARWKFFSRPESFFPGSSPGGKIRRNAPPGCGYSFLIRRVQSSMKRSTAGRKCILRTV